MALKQCNYKNLAEYYDAIELSTGDNYEKINNLLDRFFKKYKAKTVLDMTCGTGAQTISLRKKGYKITGSDISRDMLKIARKKSKGRGIPYYHGDIRTSQFGTFDAVIAIFNAIGHLSKKDFSKAVRNVGRNLKDEGLFIFDIFNLDFMKSGGFIKYKFIDEASEHDGKKFVRFNKNKINYKSGIMRMNQETYIQQGLENPNLYKESWDMQLYSSDELKEILERSGFRVIGFYDFSGKKLNKKKNLSILTVVQKA